MDKHIWYGNCFKGLYKTYRELLKSNNFDTEKTIEYLKKQAIKCEKRDPDGNYEREIAMFELDLNKSYMHIYFETKELKNFLWNLQIKNFNDIKNSVMNSEYEFMTDETGEHGKMLNICIHVPFEKEGYAFSICVKDNEDDNMYIYTLYNDCTYRIDEKTFKKINGKTTNSVEVECCNFATFVLNTIAYMISFPDYVQDGVPKILLKNRKIKTLNNKLLSISPDILEKTSFDNEGRIVIPHFRKGHFRKLTSDYYVNKKGQLVFIKETMVKGAAVTLLENKKALSR